MIYFTSDLHLGHDREFIYKSRGFDNIKQMNDAVITNWNELVKPEEEVYINGDVMLGDNTAGLELFKQLNGKIHIIWGNHDTDVRKELLRACSNVVSTGYADMLRYAKYHFFLTHYPCMTGNLEKESLKKTTLNLFGHTHSKNKFYNDMPFMYNVAMDAHNCTPVSIDEIIMDMNDKVKECIEFL